MIDLTTLGQRAKAASHHLARANTEQKNRALLAIADTLDANALSSSITVTLSSTQAGSLNGAQGNATF